MIVCNNPRLLFIHIEKTGGTTVRRVLSSNFRNCRLVGSRHNSAIESRRILGPKSFDLRYRFAFVRNPWDRMVSWYIALTQYPDRPYPRRRFVPKGVTFRDFLEKCQQRPFVRTQWAAITDERGSLLVDDVFRFENFEAEVARLGKRLGMGVASVPHYNATEHRPYTSYYDRATRRIVRQRFAEDIERFGYRFGK